MTLRRPAVSALWFAAPLVAVYAGALVVVEALPHADAPGALAAGLTLDLVVLVPALFAVVLVRGRGRGWSAVTLAPVVLLSYGAASLLVPPGHRALLDALGYAVPAVEGALVGAVGYKVWCAARAGHQSRAGDVYDRVRETLRRAVGAPAVAGALAYEVSLFYYAFAVGRAEPPAHGFAYHRRSGYGAVFAAVLMTAAVELVAVHVLLVAWSETAAWVHAAVSVYGLVWLVGDYRAMRRRPHTLGADGLRLRYGLRWDLAVPWSAVASVERTRRPDPGDDYLSTVPVGAPRYVVALRRPAEAVGPYGVTRRVSRVGLVVDDPDAFEARLRDLGVPVT